MLKGIFPVIPTLFTEDGTVDLSEQRSVVRFALHAGTHGLVFPGVASEYNFLTHVERGELIALIASEVNGRIPIVGGASANNVEQVIAAGEQALAHGIEHLMIMAPIHLGQELAAHKLFFSKISAALAGSQIILQNAPSPVGAGLNPASILALVAANPAITYVKEETLPSGPAISALQSAGIEHLKGVFGGGGARYIINELDRGTLGAMPAVELADLHVALYDAHARQDHERARNLYRLSLPLLNFQAVYRMRLTKHVLSKRGIAHALHVRAPLPVLDEFAVRDVDLMLADLKHAAVEEDAFSWIGS